MNVPKPSPEGENYSTFSTDTFVEFVSERSTHVPGDKPLPRPPDRPRILPKDEQQSPDEQ